MILDDPNIHALTAFDRTSLSAGCLATKDVMLIILPHFAFTMCGISAEQVLAVLIINWL